MAYDEGLAERLRNALQDERGIAEKKMFGGLAFLLDGKMCVGVVKDDLLVRVGSERNDEALTQPHARPMDFTGRPMKGFIYVAQDGLDTEKRLEWWVSQGVAFARTAVSSKAKRKTRTTRR